MSNGVRRRPLSRLLIGEIGSRRARRPHKRELARAYWAELRRERDAKAAMLAAIEAELAELEDDEMPWAADPS